MTIKTKISALLALLFFANPSQAQNGDALVTDLSKNQVAIQADFTGETILLFGAIDTDADSPLDVAIVVKGPNQPLTVRRKSKMLGIWVNDAALPISHVPAYYAVASTRNMRHIADDNILRHYGLGLQHLPVRLADQSQSPHAAPFIDGLIRNKQARDLYQQSDNGVRVINNRLFRAELALPSGVPVGKYEAHILLFRDGQVVSRRTNRLHVGIQGFEQYLYRWAHELPLLYGITGVLISIFCGWGAAILFRRRG